MTKGKGWTAKLLILALAVMLLTACGEKTDKIQDSPDASITEEEKKPAEDAEKNTEEEKEEQEQKPAEVPIYSINDDSLESEQTYVTLEEVTPEAVVQAVVDSFEEHSLEVGVESVTMEQDTVIVSFLFGKAPLTSVGSTVEETILNSIADSLLDNVEGCRKVIFRAEGEAYESGHYAFGIDEVYAAE